MKRATITVTIPVQVEVLFKDSQASGIGVHEVVIPRQPPPNNWFLQLPNVMATLRALGENVPAAG